MVLGPLVRGREGANDWGEFFGCAWRECVEFRYGGAKGRWKGLRESFFRVPNKKHLWSCQDVRMLGCMSENDRKDERRVFTVVIGAAAKRQMDAAVREDRVSICEYVRRLIRKDLEGRGVSVRMPMHGGSARRRYGNLRGSSVTAEARRLTGIAS